MNIYIYIYYVLIKHKMQTGLDDAVVKSSVNRLVETEFASWYQRQPKMF